MPKKKILLTNDDGLFAPGLLLVAECLAQQNEFELRLAAPEQEQSGVGHKITIFEPLFAEPVTMAAPLQQIPTFKIAGTPADCVKLALTNLFPDFQPDLVLSGINRGPNVGVNVLYSGTVGGAYEACINGFPAIALSIDVGGDGLWHFPAAARAALPIIKAALEYGLPPWGILNVNLPNCPLEKMRSVKLTRHGLSGFKEYYIEEQAQGTRRRFRLEGDMLMRESEECFDTVALKQGYISVTPLGLNFESARHREQVARWPLFQ
jgi:5'-nucleotidase